MSEKTAPPVVLVTFAAGDGYKFIILLKNVIFLRAMFSTLN